MERQGLGGIPMVSHLSSYVPTLWGVMFVTSLPKPSLYSERLRSIITDDKQRVRRFDRETDPWANGQQYCPEMREVRFWEERLI